LDLLEKLSKSDLLVGQGVLDFLGFPWILSSESSLFNGLRGESAE
jgi:hypothetical protein